MLNDVVTANEDVELLVVVEEDELVVVVVFCTTADTKRAPQTLLAVTPDCRVFFM